MRLSKLNLILVIILSACAANEEGETIAISLESDDPDKMDTWSSVQVEPISPTSLSWQQVVTMPADGLVAVVVPGGAGPFAFEAEQVHGLANHLELAVRFGPTVEQTEQLGLSGKWWVSPSATVDMPDPAAIYLMVVHNDSDTAQEVRLSLSPETGHSYGFGWRAFDIPVFNELEVEELVDDGEDRRHELGATWNVQVPGFALVFSEPAEGTAPDGQTVTYDSPKWIAPDRQVYTAIVDSREVYMLEVFSAEPCDNPAGSIGYYYCNLHSFTYPNSIGEQAVRLEASSEVRTPTEVTFETEPGRVYAIAVHHIDADHEQRPDELLVNAWMCVGDDAQTCVAGQ